MSTWWKAVLTHQTLHAADACGVLHAIGADGARELSGNGAEAFFVQSEETFPTLGAVASAIELAGFTISSLGVVEEENWVQKSRSDHFPPLTIGDLTITPIMDGERGGNHPSSDSQIFLIPGFGWGTGHHPSTKLSIELLQTRHLKSLNPSSILDMGIGSGVLSIVATKLFPSAQQIIGVDIDDRALENARDNLILNGVESRVTLTTTPASGPFSLIMANIYAEVLVVLEPQFSREIAPNGCIVLAGIIEPLLGIVKEAFSPERWQLLEQRQEEEWVALVFQKRV